VNLKYLILRLLRHFMPESVARFLLKRRWIIRPGLESSDPVAAADRYVQVLNSLDVNLKGKRVLVFGYGGRFAVGVELLMQGAAHVILCDHFVLLDHKRNLELLPKYADYLVMDNGDVQPRSEFITLLHGDIRDGMLKKQIAHVDFVLSTSVYEHLEDVDGITSALADLTTSQGIHLHFVDLRDHYFKYPFEMLTYSSRIWKSFLNPTSNLNRLRLMDYKRIFDKHFKKANIHVIEHLKEEFETVQGRVRPEFKTGDLSVDSVTLIQVLASEPFQGSD
jgi:hypothetical protein